MQNMYESYICMKRGLKKNKVGIQNMYDSGHTYV